jgi:hypothetical protein
VSAQRGIPASGYGHRDVHVPAGVVLVVGTNSCRSAAGRGAGVRVLRRPRQPSTPPRSAGFWAGGPRATGSPPVLGAFPRARSRDDTPTADEPVVILQRVPEEPDPEEPECTSTCHPPDPAGAHRRGSEEPAGRPARAAGAPNCWSSMGIWWQRMADPQGNEFCVVTDPPPAP